MTHKLRVLVRVDAHPGTVTLQVSGCLTQPDFASLLDLLRGAGRLGVGADVIIDPHGSPHLDPEILLQLRSLAAPGGTIVTPDGSDGDVLALLEKELAAMPLDVATGARGDASAAAATIETTGGWLDSGADVDWDLVPAEPSTARRLELSDYFESTLDPAATVRTLSGPALEQLADALYQHLDTSSPSFGAHTWYELAAEELQNRHRGATNGPAEGGVAAGQALA